MEQAVTPVAGINSDRLKAKRRKQMLAGKLGSTAKAAIYNDYQQLAAVYEEACADVEYVLPFELTRKELTENA